jgi:hypothetical protein
MTLKEAYIAFINLPMVLTRIADNYLEYKTGEQTITYFDDRTLSLDRTGIFDSRFYVLSACSDSDIVKKIERLVRFDKPYENEGLPLVDIWIKLGLQYMETNEFTRIFPSAKSLPTQEEKLPTDDITHVVTPSTNYYLFRGLKT